MNGITKHEWVASGVAALLVAGALLAAPLLVQDVRTDGGVSLTNTAYVASQTARAVDDITNFYPRRSWLVWASGTGTYHVSALNGGHLFSSTNFVMAMNWALSNANAYGVNSIDIGSHYRAAYTVDAPIIVDSYITIRGQGNYGTHLQLASEYPGPAVVIGSNVAVGGIVRIERIRFDGQSTNSYNPMIHSRRCAEPNISECEVVEHAGPALLIESIGVPVHWAEINRCWFVNQYSTTSPYVVVRSSTNYPVAELSIQGCKFGSFHRLPGVQSMLSISGDVRNLRISGNTFHRWYGGYLSTTNPLVVLKASGPAGNWLISGNVFEPAIGSCPSLWLDVSSGNTGIFTIVGNTFWCDSGKVSIAVSGRSTNVLVLGNMVPPGAMITGATAAVMGPDFVAGAASLTGTYAYAVGASNALAGSVAATSNRAEMAVAGLTNDLWVARRVHVAGYAVSMYGANMSPGGSVRFDQCPSPATNVFLGADWTLGCKTGTLTDVSNWWTNFYARVIIFDPSGWDEGSPLLQFELTPAWSTTITSFGVARISGSFRTNISIGARPIPSPRVYPAAVVLHARSLAATNVSFVTRTYWLDP